MGRKRISNSDVLAETYHAFGCGFKDAKEAFSNIENRTKETKIDLSIASFLSPWEGNDGKIDAAFLNGEQKICYEHGSLTATNMRNVDIDIPDNYFGKITTILLDGSVEPDRNVLVNPDAFLIGATATHQIGRLLGVEYTSETTGRFLRDYQFASKCAALPGAKDVSLVYREDNGVKKIFGCFLEERPWLLLDDIIDMVCEISDRTDSDFFIREWDINQRSRKVSFVKSEGNDVLTFTWSDCIQSNLALTYNGKKIKTEGLNLVIAATKLVA